jgi:hypothetical protein
MSETTATPRASTDDWIPIFRNLIRTKVPPPQASPKKCKGHQTSGCQENWSLYIQCQDPTTDCDNAQPTIDASLLTRKAADGKGQGIFAARPIPQGTTLGHYYGELISTREATARHGHKQPSDPFYHFQIDPNTVIDATRYGTELRYVNHSDMPNCGMQLWTVNGHPTLRLITLTHITTHTEITYNYFHSSPPPQLIPCRCKSTNCSGWMGRPIPRTATTSKQRPIIPPPTITTLDEQISHDTKHLLNNPTLPDLDPNGLLSDTTFHKWLTHWASVHNLNYNTSKHNNPSSPHWILSTFFYTRLASTNFDPQSVHTWSRNIDLTIITHVYIPIHLPRLHHWILVVIDTTHHTITNYDSLCTRRPDILHRIATWWEHLNLSSGQQIDTKKWTKRNPKTNTQSNNKDCGIYALLHIAYLTSHTHTIHITTHTPQTIRTWLALPIAHQISQPLRQKRKASLQIPNTPTTTHTPQTVPHQPSPLSTTPLSPPAHSPDLTHHNTHHAPQHPQPHTTTPTTVTQYIIPAHHEHATHINLDDATSNLHPTLVHRRNTKPKLSTTHHKAL